MLLKSTYHCTSYRRNEIYLFVDMNNCGHMIQYRTVETIKIKLFLIVFDKIIDSLLKPHNIDNV